MLTGFPLSFSSVSRSCRHSALPSSSAPRVEKRLCEKSACSRLDSERIARTSEATSSSCIPFRATSSTTRLAAAFSGREGGVEGGSLVQKFIPEQKDCSERCRVRSEGSCSAGKALLCSPQ